MINYIVACYVGKRRNALADPLMYVKNHIKWLESAIGVNNAIFVFNDANKFNFNLQKEAIELIKEAGHEYIVRPNMNMSYGAWSAGLKHIINDKKYKYSFLIEDDYIPSNRDSLNYFLNEMTYKTGFVASFYQTPNVVGQTRNRFNHAAISNGLISHNAIRTSISDIENIFMLTAPIGEQQLPNKSKKIVLDEIGDNENKIQYFNWLNDKYQNGDESSSHKIYGIAVTDQRYFLNHLVDKGYEMKDITDSNYTLFFSCLDQRYTIHIFGNKEGICLIEPNFDFSSMEKLGDKNYQIKKYDLKAL